jgi:hypothetical protein
MASSGSFSSLGKEADEFLATKTPRLHKLTLIYDGMKAEYASNSPEQQEHMDKYMSRLLEEIEYIQKTIKRIHRARASPPNPIKDEGSVRFMRTEGMRDYITHAIRDRQRGEIAWMWHQKQNEVAFGTKEDMRGQTKEWKRHIKMGKILPVLEDNNKSPIVGGKQYYTFCVCPVEWEIDPSGFSWEKETFLINGIIVYFKSKENRDALFKYLSA